MRSECTWHIDWPTGYTAAHLMNGNGEGWCTSPLGRLDAFLTPWLADEIRPACMQHDQCYSLKKAKNKDECDDLQWLNAEFICHSYAENWARKRHCFAEIDLQHWAVQNHAEDNFNDAKEVGC